MSQISLSCVDGAFLLTQNMPTSALPGADCSMTPATSNSCKKWPYSKPYGSKPRIIVRLYILLSNYVPRLCITNHEAAACLQHRLQVRRHGSA